MPTANDPHVLTVLNNGREWITANQRLHWGQRSLRTRQWREATFWQAKAARVPYVPQALVVCELLFSTSHRRDPANWAPTAKACVDGLVDAGVFDDDDHKHVTGPDMRLGEVVPRMSMGLRLHIMAKE